MLFLIPWSSTGSLSSVGKFTHSQASFRLGAPCSWHLVPSTVLRPDAQPPSHNNIKCCCLLWAYCSDTILLCLGSVFWIYELVTFVNEFIWTYRSTSCYQLLWVPVSSSAFSRTVSPPGWLLKPLKLTCFLLAFIYSLGKLPLRDAEFLSSFQPWTSRLDLHTWTNDTGSTNSIQNHFQARVLYHLVLNT